MVYNMIHVSIIVQKRSYLTFLSKQIAPHIMEKIVVNRCKLKPEDRYEAHSKFMADLNQPNPDFSEKNRIPLIESNPLIFWQTLCGILGATIVVLLLMLANG